MPVFIVERTFAESFDPTHEVVESLEDYYDEHEIRWISSFLSADQKRSYCLYEADSADLLIKHADDMGIPLDSVMMVSEIERPPRD